MRMIIKYKNRKLYDHTTKTYTSMNKLRRLLENKEDFTVFDKNTKTDITYSIKVKLLTDKLLTDTNAGAKIIDNTFNLIKGIN